MNQVEVASVRQPRKCDEFAINREFALFIAIPTSIEDQRSWRAEPVANRALVVVNVLAFILFQSPSWFLDSGAAWWSIFTYAFAHASPWHLIGNMYVLLLVGNAVNRRIGNLHYLTAYLGAVLLLGLLGRMTGIGPLGGSSGAIFSVVAILLMLMPVAIIECFYTALFPVTLVIGLIKRPDDFAGWFIRWGTFRSRAWWFFVVVPVMELWGLLWWRVSLGQWQWAHPAHLLGLLCGIGIVLLLPARITLKARQHSL